ncbi:hypothetical protein [Candidatus Marithrix sp. Canyon 246]|uniref:hypothetical protein n=1 Tax=Candidatus Marithrix sp. Canyon 246 TaxID=1827136 RepID=UPI00084A0EEA|nr:hypothetical protein [Candidatus Marithrix sp. Canyon 246]
MGSQNKKKTIQNTVAGGLLIATAPVFAKSGGAGATEGGKNQLGVNHLSLEQFPGRNATVCADETANTGKGGTNVTPNDLTIAVDPFEGNFISVEFVVRDVVAHNQDYILYLVYSPILSPTPQIPTPKSTNKLGLDRSALEIVSILDIPAQKLLPQGPTRLGAADPRPHSAVSFNFNFDTSTLPGFIRDNEKVYFQAALISKRNFNAGNFSEMILSEVDTIGFVANNCTAGQQTVGNDDEGGLTKSTNITAENVEINSTSGK